MVVRALSFLLYVRLCQIENSWGLLNGSTSGRNGCCGLKTGEFRPGMYISVLKQSWSGVCRQMGDLVPMRDKREAW
ncbi:MAG: hypothetical protein ABSF91_00355 [Bacteroidota bacterium]